MRRAGSSAIIALLLLAQGARSANGQDTTLAAAPAAHQLPLDTARVRPFRRTYDLVVHRGDSSEVIGARDVALQPAVYAGSSAWLIIDVRTGSVQATDSLFVGPDLHPIHYSSELGQSRLALEFVGDSVYGAITTPATRQNVVIAGRRDLLVSNPFVEVTLSALPLAPGWTDSASVLAIDATSHTIDSATIVVVGEEELVSDSTTVQAYVVALRSDRANALYWVRRDDHAVVRELQSAPAHVGTTLEQRLRPSPP